MNRCNNRYTVKITTEKLNALLIDLPDCNVEQKGNVIISKKCKYIQTLLEECINEYLTTIFSVSFLILHHQPYENKRAVCLNATCNTRQYIIITKVVVIYMILSLCWSHFSN